MQENMENILAGLNGEQRKAVLHDHEQNAQLLILAGAGSGKTSVLTKRIQYRILCGVPPEKILALTFTAKAAAEMRERVQALFPNAGVRLCTFHSLALYMLKCKIPCMRNGKVCQVFGYELIGFKKPPTPTEVPVREYAKKLAQYKIRARRHARELLLRENLFSYALANSLQKKLSPLREEVRASGSVVFDDLIFEAIHLIESFSEAREFFQQMWREILVDEYQDINPSQYRLVKGLLGNRKELFVVGDDDQAIYGFRGADIGNINRFREDFKGSALIRLEWNYRSTPNILQFANTIFKGKPIQLQKVLRAGNLNGSHGNPLFKENRKPEIWTSENPVEEMQKIVARVKELREGYDLKWSVFAILVRYNRQRLYYEAALHDYGIPVASAEAQDGIHVETVHASKGLQYTVVFYAGLAEGLTPGECIGPRKKQKMQLEEERRLYYVGVTRAESYLILLYCKHRFWKGSLCRMKRSRFLPKESPSRRTSLQHTDFEMPFIFSKITFVLLILGYLGFYIAVLPFAMLYHGKNLDAWVNSHVQSFSAFCLKHLKIDLNIVDQAKLAKVDWNRPVFVVGNHNSFADIPIVFLTLQRTIGFVAKESLGKIPFLHFWMMHVGCVLVNRKKGGASAAIRKAIAERGTAQSLFIFPEGTRSKDGTLGEFKSGAFRFAKENDGIILPIVIKNSAAAWENRKDMSLCKVTATILDPIDVGELNKANPSMDPKLDLLPDVRSKMENVLLDTSV